MRKAQPLYDPATGYRILVRGRVDEAWLQSFENSVEISVEQPELMENVTVLTVYTDQSGIVGLVRKLHGLGMTILQLQVVSLEYKGRAGLE